MLLLGIYTTRRDAPRCPAHLCRDAVAAGLTGAARLPDPRGHRCGWPWHPAVGRPRSQQRRQRDRQRRLGGRSDRSRCHAGPGSTCWKPPSSTGPAPDAMAPTPTPRTRPAACTCRSTRPTTSSAGSTAGVLSGGTGGLRRLQAQPRLSHAHKT